jgi:bifunctional DNA-binding transcriptional regulator/antitoxin component of YhaV-PrlF toxin-antitoxin module
VNFERGPGRHGQAVISRRRLLTIPVAPAAAAGLAGGDRLRVVADGPGRLILERIDEAASMVPALFTDG